MPSLTPAGYQDLILENPLTNNPIGYKRGSAWSDGDFVRDGSNKISPCSGLDSWYRWCQNCLNHKRYSSPYYSSNFGLDTPNNLAELTHGEVENILSRIIPEALLADPYGRTKSAEILSFTWEGGVVAVQVALTGLGQNTLILEVNYN